MVWREREIEPEDGRRKDERESRSGLVWRKDSGGQGGTEGLNEERMKEKKGNEGVKENVG